MRIVEVTWEDARSEDSWQPRTWTKGFHSQPVICVTVGILLHRDKRALTLAASMAPTGTVSSTWRIPAGIVKRVRVLGTLTKAAGRRA